jgi:hypothetical protein
MSLLVGIAVIPLACFAAVPVSLAVAAYCLAEARRKKRERNRSV